ncbi:MAG TPA: hypothetical protein VH913_14100 [Hyphomicrobiaceae bacterium]|jgi:hypothetical protein
MPRYVIRRRRLPVLPARARVQLVELVFHEDREVAQLAAMELLDRCGHDVITVRDEGEVNVFQRWWLDMVMPRSDCAAWRVGVRSALWKRWARFSTRVPPLVPMGVPS